MKTNDRFSPFARVIGGAVALALSLPAWPDAACAAEVEGVLWRTAERGEKVRMIVRLDLPQSAQALVEGGVAGDDYLASVAAIQEYARGELAGTDAAVTGYETLPFLVVEGGTEALAALARSGVVASVREDRLESLSLTSSVPAVQADRLHRDGIDGQDWVIAILDTGVDSSHPFLAGKVVDEACFSNNGSCPNGTGAQMGPGAGAPCNYADGACPHGTHVAGIAVGTSSSFSGVAPGGSVMAIQVFSRFTGSTCDDDSEDPCAKTFESDTVRALEYVFQQRNRFQIAAANLSFGGDRYTSQAECDAQGLETGRKLIIDNLRLVGIPTVTASGNSGFTNATTSPACISSAVAVGAVDGSDEVASFSNSAPFLTFLAPGVRISSASSRTGGFEEISGTSQATPHVAGAFALLYQQLGGADIDRVQNALFGTGVPVTDPRNSVVTPSIRIENALLSLGGPSSSGVQVTRDGQRTLVSKDVGAERWAITQNFDDGSVTGNVFRSDGGPTSFVWCERRGDDGNRDPFEIQITYGCFGAEACSGTSCGAGSFTELAEVTLPGSFFLPERTGAPRSNLGRVAGMASAGSGIQITPDAAMRVLVSKDVGAERWAITQNPDGTVTGNVFFPGGGEPAFIWCEELGRADGQINYSCYNANRCLAVPCTSDQWAFLAEAPLPESFFQP